MMRLSLTVLLVFALASPALAEPPAPSPPTVTKPVKAPRASVVAVMKNADQALLWDGIQGEYVVVRVGSKFHHLVVTSIERDQVILTHRATNQHFILPRTTDTSDIKGDKVRKKVKPSGSAKPRKSDELVDPYKSSGRSGGLIDPYARSKARKGEVIDPYAPANRPPRVSEVRPPVVRSQRGRKAQREERRKVSRRKFDAAITDFDRLGKRVRMQLVSQGVQLTKVSRRSLFYRMGLRSGDIVLSVAGQPIRGVDDAAAVYARLTDAKKFVVKVQRKSSLISFRYRFTR